jgi:phosphopentomutase
MTIDQAFKELIKNWKEQDAPFKNKYRSYKSKYLKSLKDKKSEKIGLGKIREMLLEAGYKEDWTHRTGNN